MASTQSETGSVRKPFQKGTELTEMELMYAETFKQLEEGSIVEGGVVAVQAEGVVVDIGYKSEGIVPREEFAPEELSALKVGDRFLVYLEEREDADGNMILSKEKADRMKIWGDLERIFEKAEVIEGKVLTKIKGGMMVDIGIKAFLPGSQIDLRPVRDLDALIGKTFQMRIIKMNHRRSNVVVSRRVVLEENRDRRKQQAMATLAEGQMIDGQVKNITDYGAFIDLGGIDGLLHITDMSWGRVAHPSELFMVGDRVKVMILKYDRETGRISLGVKQLKPDPWMQVEEKYSVGSRVRGRVVSLVDYGAFVELEPGIEGLVHISEMTWSHEIKHPSKLVSVGDQVDAQVLNVERKGRKISLGMKQMAANPWEVVESKYAVGAIIEGKVKSLTEFGVFVGLEEGIDGLIHISDLSWTKRVTHPGDLFKKGQAVKAVVLRVDKEKERLSLGYKQLTPDPWEHDIPTRYQVGQDVQGKIVKITDFGAFVECEDGVEGLIHVSEMALEGQRIEERHKVGDEVAARVIRVDAGERKIALSIREQVGDWGLPEGDEQRPQKHKG
jgi:small subunit ribosomal protein S1